MEGAGGRGMGWLALEAFDPAPIAVALTVGSEHRLVYSNLAFRTYIVDRPLGNPSGTRSVTASNATTAPCSTRC